LHKHIIAWASAVGGMLGRCSLNIFPGYTYQISNIHHFFILIWSRCTGITVLGFLNFQLHQKHLWLDCPGPSSRAYGEYRSVLLMHWQFDITALRQRTVRFVKLQSVNRWYRDDVVNTIQANCSTVSLIWMCYFPSARSAGCISVLQQNITEGAGWRRLACVIAVKQLLLFSCWI